MPDQEFTNLIKANMRGWDGTPPPPVNVSRPQLQQGEAEARLGAVIEWAKKMEAWGKQVRRDILVLERHVAKLTGPSADPKRMFYGDPGDPPPTEPL